MVKCAPTVQVSRNFFLKVSLGKANLRAGARGISATRKDQDNEGEPSYLGAAFEPAVLWVYDTETARIGRAAGRSNARAAGTVPGRKKFFPTRVRTERR